MYTPHSIGKEGEPKALEPGSSPSGISAAAKPDTIHTMLASMAASAPT